MRWYGCILFIMISSVALTQESAEGLPTPYLNDTFQQGTLYYRETDPQTAELNYHKVSEEMVMKLREHKVPINDIEAVDSIRLGNALFVRIEDQFYEQLLSSPMQLLIRHRATSQQATKTGAYGTKAHTGGVATPLNIEERYDYYALVWAEHKVVIDRPEYFIRENDTFHKANNAKQFLSIFPDRKKEFKKLLSENKINFEQPQDIKRALLLCLSQN